MHHTARRILVLTRFLPSRERDGSAAYLDAVLSHLVDRGDVVEVHAVLADSSPVRRIRTDLPVRVSADRSLVVGRLILRATSPKAALLHGLRSGWIRSAAFRRTMQPLRQAVPRRAPRVPVLAQPLRPDEVRRIRRRIRGGGFDVVIANYQPMAAAFEADGTTQRILLAHDVLHDRLRDRSLDPAQVPVATRDGEADLLRRADVVCAIQWTDARRFSELAPDTEVVTVPMPAVPSPSPPPRWRARSALRERRGRARSP